MPTPGSRVRLLRNAFGVQKGTEGVVISVDWQHVDERYVVSYSVKFPTAVREVLLEDVEVLAGRRANEREVAT